MQNKTLKTLSFLFLLFIISSCNRDTIAKKPLVSPEIQKKVDELMKLERDSIFKANGIKAISKFAPDDIGGPCTINATSGITGTSNGITGVFTVNGNTISGFNYSVSGLHGTITQVGSVSQSVFQGVTTYQVVLSGTWTIRGVQYTSNVLIYGNIYNCQATIGGLILS
jgi:hypothetical protein